MPLVQAQWRTPHGLDRAPFMDRLFESIDNDASMGRCTDAPPDDASGTGVDDRAMGTPLVRETVARGDINEPLPGGDIGEV